MKTSVLKKGGAAVPMVVTTALKGVFFGYGVPKDTKTLTITKARMCVSWSADMRGVMGLAAMGPSRSCKVSPPVEKVTLQDVTAVMEVTPEVAEKWEAGPWGS